MGWVLFQNVRDGFASFWYRRNSLRVREPSVLALVLLAFPILTPGLARSAEAQQALPVVNLKTEALPNFQVRLTWTSPASDTEFEIVRLRADSVGAPRVVPVPWRSGVPGFGPAEGLEQSYVDRDVVPLTAYRYEIRLLGAAGVDAWEKSNVDVLGNEVVVDGHVNLAALDFTSRPVHRLWLRAGAELVTDGSDLDLTLVELRADGATVMTFIEGAEAAPGKKGRDGGAIRITAQRAVGTSLTIIGRGEKGGRGATATIHRVRTQIPASNGGLTEIEIVLGCSAPFHSLAESGGSSSLIQIKIVETSNLAIEPELSFGKGGDGGTNCLSSNEVKTEPNGPDGRNLSYCLNIGSIRRGSC
jgi:hypothetical protein